ncbi:substrate-binding domain-containing protein [Microbacterium sp. SD291]|uniref:substrate-binding domain-containing protein n=1 Tax=Microbacterium sp. SD291 TaxID=2782007 RepID=UPI001F61F79D|nr:substrate-binding domain-containing protein [Microbacterium sp. SD291]
MSEPTFTMRTSVGPASDDVTENTSGGAIVGGRNTVQTAANSCLGIVNLGKSPTPGTDPTGHRWRPARGGSPHRNGATITVEEGAAAGARLLTRPRREWPDALFAANDLVALGLLQSLVSDGRVLVPDEIALIGFDDISFAAAAAVPLSSICQLSRAIRRTALRIVLEEAADPDSTPRQTVFPPEPVVRRSTAG